jgi:hypothetical protein
MTHPGVGALTALAFVLIIGTPERFRCGKQSVISGNQVIATNVPEPSSLALFGAELIAFVGITRTRLLKR